jgi:hypothetical protein
LKVCRSWNNRRGQQRISLLADLDYKEVPGTDLKTAREEMTMAKTMHANEFHMAKSDALFFSGTSLMALSGLVLTCVLLAWMLGGADFKDSFYGNIAIVLSFAGLITGAVIDHLALKR